MVFNRFNSHGYNSLIIHHIKNSAEGRQRLFFPFHKYFCQNKMPSSKAKEMIRLSSYRHFNKVFVFQKPCYNQWKLERHRQNSIFSVPKHYGKTYAEVWCWLILTCGSSSVGYITFLKEPTPFFHQITLFISQDYEQSLFPSTKWTAFSLETALWFCYMHHVKTRDFWYLSRLPVVLKGQNQADVRLDFNPQDENKENDFVFQENNTKNISIFLPL